MIKKLGIVLLILCFTVPCFGKARWYNATSHTGGGDGAVDSINGQNLFDGDKLIVVTTTNTYFYTLDVDSAASEDTNSYTVISPDSNAGDKRWVIETIVYDFAYSTFVDEDATPDVSDENLFYTNTTTGTPITRFDNGIAGQEITIHSKGAITFDLTANDRLIGSSADLVTASGDILVFLCMTGGTTSSVWQLVSYNDISDDHS